MQAFFKPRVKNLQCAALFSVILSKSSALQAGWFYYAINTGYSSCVKIQNLTNPGIYARDYELKASSGFSPK